MPDLINQAQPPLEFIPPAFSPAVHQFMRLLLPAWLRWGSPIRRIQSENVETLCKLYQEFQSGQTRLLLAFRHPSTYDPLCIGSLIWQELPQVARRQGIALKQPIHAHFIYDRGIPLWAGSVAGWLYSRLGGTPIQRGKLDRVGLRSARELLVNGKFPLAAAPEGATNGHGEIVSPLEPGIAQLGFWCMEDLVKAGRSEQVLIVPIGLQYRYITPPWEALDQLLRSMESDLGVKSVPASIRSGQLGNEQLAQLYPRLYQLGEALLTQMEGFYQRFYHQTPLTPDAEAGSLPLGERLKNLLDTALRVAEQYFNVPAKGSVIDRCRRLEQAGWDCIYREDLKQIESLSAVERGLADRIAEEASLRMWHMRLVESFVAVTGRYVMERPTAERFAETALLMWETLAKIKGNNSFTRPQLGEQWVQITVGQPLSVSDRWERYQANRRSAKQEVETLTQELQTALETMIC